MTWNFTYNADGIRTKRTTCAACTGSTTCEACGEGTSNATTYSYVYNGSSLSQMTIFKREESARTETTLNFLYDANGAPMVVICNGKIYYYVTNLQGDVIAILDSTGTAVVEYNYDAWGKLLSTITDPNNDDAADLGLYNPLRYRAYIYDPETALYYLQSRCYDPELGRFINADAFASTGQGILGNNMFAYCLNNPAQHSDGTGNYARTANPNANCYEAHPAGGGGGIPIGAPIGVGSGIGRAIEKLRDTISKSYARSGTHGYRSPKEVHHLVAKEAWNARPAAAILNETLPGGVENPLNKISIKTGLHRRLHTKVYYGIVNSYVIGAYYSGNDTESRQQNVVISLIVLRAIVSTLDSIALY